MNKALVRAPAPVTTRNPRWRAEILAAPRQPGRAAAGLLATWLMALAAVAPAQELALDEEQTVRRALSASPLLEASRHRLNAAAAAGVAADAARLPMLTAGGSAAYRSSVPEFAAPLGGPGQPGVVLFPDIRTVAALALEASQPLYTGGAITARREAAQAELAAAEKSTSQVRLELRLAARVAYWQAVAGLAGVTVATHHLQRATSLAEDVRAARRVGLAAEADVLAAEAAVAAASVAAVRADRAAGDALAGLRSLLALPADAAIRLADTAPPSPPPPPGELDALQALARRQRPELEVLRARADALAARAQATLAGARPAISAQAAWELARPNPRFLPLADRWNDSWSVGLAARWTLWDGGRTSAAAASLEAERQAIQAELAEWERRVALEVEQARAGVLAELAAITAAEASRAAATAHLQATRDRHAAGLATTTDVLDAQAQLATAEGERLLAAVAAHLAAARLERAVGS